MNVKSGARPEEILARANKIVRARGRVEKTQIRQKIVVESEDQVVYPNTDREIFHEYCRYCKKSPDSAECKACDYNLDYQLPEALL
jgi:hypothetical protein